MVDRRDEEESALMVAVVDGARVGVGACIFGRQDMGSGRE